MTAHPADRTLLSLPDIARLARVQRPVVSMWRSRSAGTATPFPDPVDRSRGVERFAAEDVVAWLATTGRGNNPRAAEDVGALMRGPDAPLDDPTTFAGITALLTLTGESGDLPTDVQDLMDLADETDPDDEFLLGEIEALGDQAGPLARRAERAVDASTSAATAFDRVRRDRDRSAGARPDGSLSSPAVDLLAALVAGLRPVVETRVDGDDDAPFRVLDPLAGAGPVLDALVSGFEGRPWSAVVRSGGDTEARLALRSLVVHGVPLRIDPWVSTPARGGATIALAVLPPLASRRTSSMDVLRAVNDLLDGLPSDAISIVLAPAAALCDDLRPTFRATTNEDEAAQALRSDLIGDAGVRAIIRLPTGLRPSRPRERLALWLLWPDAAGAPRDRGPAITLVGDVGRRPLSRAAISAIVSDVAAWLPGGDGALRHEWQVLRPTATVSLVAAEGDLVQAPVRDHRTPLDPGAAVRAARLVSLLGTPSSAPSLLIPQARITARPRRKTTLGDAIRDRRLQHVPGLRLDPAMFGPTDGGVPVITVDDLVAAHPGGPPRSIDRLTLQAVAPHFTYTEPGDVVFSASGAGVTRRAWMDQGGGAVVAFPLAVLRCRRIRPDPVAANADAVTPPRVVPEVLAATICRLPAHDRAWREWTVPLFVDTEVPGVVAGLAGPARLREDLHRRLAAIDKLESIVLAAIAGGAHDLVDPPHVSHSDSPVVPSEGESDAPPHP